MIPLAHEAHALRVVREIGGKLRYYEAITFPNNPWSGCEQYLRQLNAFGSLKEDDAAFIIDILDERGDIIQDYPVNRSGFEYLRYKLKFVWTRDDEE